MQHLHETKQYWRIMDTEDIDYYITKSYETAVMKQVGIGTVTDV